MPDTVIIEKRDERSAGAGGSEVARASSASGFRAPEDEEPVMARLKFRKNRRRLVDRSVVHDDHFQHRMRLLESAPRRARNVRCTIPCWDHHGDALWPSPSVLRAERGGHQDWLPRPLIRSTAIPSRENRRNPPGPRAAAMNP